MMDKAELESEVNELVKAFGRSTDPQHRKIAELTKRANDSQKQLKKSVNSLQESLDYLRVCIKYQLFDLEATKRENKYLKKMLDEKDI